MKVILIKDSKDGKKNEIIQVSSGYGSNFLIKNGLAVPCNKVTLKDLKKNLKLIENTKQEEIKIASKLKEKLEKIELVFQLNFSNKKVHGSITNKKVYKALEEKGINLPKHTIEQVHINTLGIAYVDANLCHDIIAKVKIRIDKDA